MTPQKSDINVLIVEDNPGDQYLLTTHLHSIITNTKKIRVAESLATALNILGEFTPQIILLDLTLPDSIGIETFKKINDAQPSTPILILSGTEDAKVALQAIALGAQDYLLKGDFDEKLLARSMNYSIERKRTLVELNISVERYTLVSQATNDMVWDWDIVNNTVYRNEEQFCRMLKLPAAMKDLANEFWFGRIHPDDLLELEPLLHALNADPQKNVFESEYRFLNGNDQYIYLFDRGYILRNKEGKPIRIIGSTQDITQQKEINSELQKLSRIAQETQNGVVITDKYECIEWVNSAFERISGYSLEEIKGRKPGHFLQGPESDRSEIMFIRSQLKKQKNFEAELINYTKDGKKYWINLQVQPIFDAQGNLQQYFSIQTDITAQKRADEALKKSEEQYRYLFDNNPAPIFIWHIDDFTFAEVNETFLNVYGYTRTELATMTIKEIRPEEDIPAIVAFAKSAGKKGDFYVTRLWKHLDKKGTLMYMQISSQKITYKNRNAILAIAIDITDKKMLELKLEEERQQKEKEITTAVITAQEKEKEYIGRELHDNVNQILASARLYFGMSKKTISEEMVKNADQLVGKAIDEIRILSHSLIAPKFNITDFSVGIEEIITHIENETGIKFIKQYCNTDYSGVLEEIQLTMYRTVQEQLNNILKYAKAKNVLIQTTRNDGELTLLIKDDGIGFDSTIKRMGIGFLNIQTRAAICNGTMDLKSSPGEGCSLLLRFKL